MALFSTWTAYIFENCPVVSGLKVQYAGVLVENIQKWTEIVNRLEKKQSFISLASAVNTKFIAWATNCIANWAN